MSHRQRGSGGLRALTESDVESEDRVCVDHFGSSHMCSNTILLARVVSFSAVRSISVIVFSVLDGASWLACRGGHFNRFVETVVARAQVRAGTPGGFTVDPPADIVAEVHQLRAAVQALTRERDDLRANRLAESQPTQTVLALGSPENRNASNGMATLIEEGDVFFGIQKAFWGGCGTQNSFWGIQRFFWDISNWLLTFSEVNGV